LQHVFPPAGLEVEKIAVPSISALSALSKKANADSRTNCCLYCHSSYM